MLAPEGSKNHRPQPTGGSKKPNKEFRIDNHQQINPIYMLYIRKRNGQNGRIDEILSFTYTTPHLNLKIV